MNKMEDEKDIKYLCVCYGISPKVRATLDEVPRRGGFYNWLFLFKGDIKPYKEILRQPNPKKFLERYDVVHCNMSPIDLAIVPELRKILGTKSKTQLVVNNDYVAEVWHRWNFHPRQYWHVQEQADMVFGTEPTQTSHMIDRAKVLPHPHWIEMLKHMKPDAIDKTYGILYHWWEGAVYRPAIVDFKFKKKNKLYKSKMYAFREDVADDKRWLRAYFDIKVPPMSFPEYIDDLMSNKFVYEPTCFHTYGRNSVDLAAIGTPCIGSENVASMKRCFPYTSCDPMDIKTIVKHADRLVNDDSFRHKVIEYAKKACEYYNYENSRKRFLDALEESKNDKKEYNYE